MAFDIGERVTNSFTGPGTVIGLLERPHASDNPAESDRTPYQRIQFDHPLFGERLHIISNLQPYYPAPIKINDKFRKKCSTPEVVDFVAYLKTPEAGTLISLEAKNADTDAALREQYRRITGEGLVEGKGYHVAPETARKRQNEGLVTFIVPPEMPSEFRVKMVQRQGLINHLDFTWFLIEQGFRVTR